MTLGLGGYPPLLVAVRNRVADYGGLPRGPITCSSVHALWARAALPRVQAAPTRAKSYNRDTTTDGDCAAGAPSVCGCALPHASSCLHTPAECLQKKPYTVRPRQCALQVAGPTQSQCHPTQPYTHPIQPHPVRTSLALQTIQPSTSYPALHTSYPALCSGVAVGRDQARVLGGTRAARRLRAARRRRIDLAGCANDGRQPRGLVRLLVARARPVRQHGQSARTRGHCGARMPAQSLSRGLPEVSGPGFDHADRAPHPSY